MTKRIHMMGVGGSGMSGVAHIAAEMGYEVTGCDLEESTAYAKNIFVGHSPDHLKGVDLLIVSPAVLYQNSDNHELVEAQKRKIVMTWQEFLGKVLLKDKKLICIAGTHGKSTTTAMVGKLLIDNSFDPIVITGANVPEWGGSSRFGNGEYAVVEADEFNNNFLNYRPDIAIINNIEFDHPDFFKNEKEIHISFDKFINNLVGRKLLITEKDSLKRKFKLKVLGNHNQKNANMAFLLGRALGIKEDAIIKSIESFNGIGRRTELISNNSIKVYDDYAHHPTAIAATLQGLRELYPTSKIWAVVEAHGFARTFKLVNLYENVFTDADEVLIGPIFKARDAETFGMTPQKIAEISKHKNAKGYDSFDEILVLLKKELKEGDVVLVMGAGKSYLWAREITKIFKSEFVIENNIDLKKLTTFKIGGQAKYYAEVKNEKEIQEVYKFVKENNLNTFILGGGSDLLISDKGFNGIVIKYVGNGIAKTDDTITAGAGTGWDALVQFAVEHKLQGIECMSGIPGTVGASPVQNLGAYGQEVKDTLTSLRVFDFNLGKFINFTNNDCQFGYRDSFFRKAENYQKYLITSVSLKLKQNLNPRVEYDSLSNYLKEKNLSNPSLKEIREAVLDLRKGKLENPSEFGNAGSFFKNPIVEKEIPGIPSYPFENKFKLFAGWLIDKAGWKGKTHGGAAVSSKNALFLINKSGNASSSDVIELAKMITEDVYKKFGVRLETEVQLINF